METRIHIDWSELDLFGHVNNVAFFKYMQAARIQLCDACGLSSITPAGISFIVASSKCDFKKTLHYPGEVIIHSKIIQINTTSFVIEHHLFNTNTEIVAVGTDTLVVFDYDTREKVIIDECLKERLNQHTH
jgi:acyl-CoA thioester hydrolase